MRLLWSSSGMSIKNIGIGQRICVRSNRRSAEDKLTLRVCEPGSDEAKAAKSMLLKVKLPLLAETIASRPPPDLFVPFPYACSTEPIYKQPATQRE